jgi:hypothetical protein
VVQGVQRLVRKVEGSKGSRLEVGEYRVGVGDQTAEHLFALRAAEVHAERQIVAMCPGERLGHGFADPCLSQSVGISRTLDLDDLSAQITEQTTEFPARNDDTEVDDPQPVERTADISR